MPGHPDLPRGIRPVVLRKREIFDRLQALDNNAASRDRVLSMEGKFRARGATLLKRLPVAASRFGDFNTNPFVLMFYSRQQNYSRVGEVERDLVRAKVFSSMETSAGNMIEKIVLPVYGWETVPSEMHSYGSVLDGRASSPGPNTFVAATLKSGPRTLNDSMAMNIGSEVVKRAQSWAIENHAQNVDFTYGVLYGTKKQSNKKDWHILRNIDEGRPPGSQVNESHRRNWSISYVDGPLSVTATVRVGLEWWEYLGGEDAWLELCCALIRSCVTPTSGIITGGNYTISDMEAILDMSGVGGNYNVSLLQSSQLEWLLFLARHFCDELKD